MQQPLYLILEQLFALAGLTSYFTSHYNEIIFAISMFALLMCLFGFFIYRSVNSIIMLVIIILTSFQIIYPRYGLLPTVSTCAILGVILGLIAFMAFKVGSVTISGLLFASIAYSISTFFGISLIAIIIILIICAVMAGVLTYHFPVIGVCLFTSLWGGITLAVMGFSILQGISNYKTILLAILFSILGFILQMILSHKQTLFKKTMPEKLNYKLEKYKEEKSKEKELSKIS